MTKSNILGTFIRNRRKEIGFPDVTSFARHLSRSISYVSRVEVGSSDGPSLKFLREVASALGVDVKHLLQMKEHDDSHNRPKYNSEQTTSIGVASVERNSAAAENADLEVALHYALAAPDHFNGQTTDIGRVHASLPKANLVTGPDPLTSYPTNHSGVHLALKTQAETHLEMAEKLHVQHLWKEAHEELLLSLSIFERLEDAAGVAFACFGLGRLHRRMVHALLLNAAERVAQMMEAEKYFARAYQAFTQASQEIPDEYCDRVPECLAQWARTDEQIAKHFNYIDTENIDDVSDSAVKEKRDGLKKATQEFYMARAYAKRNSALMKYRVYIADLSSKLGEKSTQLLAGTFHRLGVLCRDFSCSELKTSDRIRFGKAGIQALEVSLQYRRETAISLQSYQGAVRERQDGLKPQDTQKQLDRLANSHADLGLSLLLYLGLRSAENSEASYWKDVAAIQEEAYWQFKVARKLYSVMELESADPRVEYVDSHLIEIQKEQVQESDIVARQEIENQLAEAVFGTKEQPVYLYPLLYRPKAAINSESELRSLLNLQSVA